MSDHRIFEYREHWLVRRIDTPHLSIYWCRPGTRRVRRRSTGTADVEEAKRRLIAFVEGRGPTQILGQAEGVMPGRNASPAILDLLTVYLKRMIEKPSYVTARSSLKHWTDFCDKEDVVFASELTADVQERFIAFRRAKLAERGQPGSNATINRDIALLSGALRYAWRRGQIAAMPFVVTLPNPPPRDKFLSANEANRLLAACDETYVYRFVLLALHTLQRPKAIFGLPVSQVDLANGTINFLPPGSLQSNKRRPMVRMTPTLHAEMTHALAGSRSGYVVEKDGLPLKSMRKAFARVATMAGLPAGTTPYVLRHTGATLLAAAGIPMQQIASMLGHTTQRTTEVYAKRRPEFQQEAVNTLDALFDGQAIEKSPASKRAPQRAVSQRGSNLAGG